MIGFVISFSRLPLMVHRTNSGIPLSSSPSSSLSCPGSLRRGDIYTHCFHGHGGSIMDRETRRIDRSVVEKQVYIFFGFFYSTIVSLTTVFYRIDLFYFVRLFYAGFGRLAGPRPRAGLIFFKQKNPENSFSSFLLLPPSPGLFRLARCRVRLLPWPVAGHCQHRPPLWKREGGGQGSAPRHEQDALAGDAAEEGDRQGN